MTVPRLDVMYITCTSSVHSKQVQSTAGTFRLYFGFFSAVIPGNFWWGSWQISKLLYKWIRDTVVKRQTPIPGVSRSNPSGDRAEKCKNEGLWKFWMFFECIWYFLLENVMHVFWIFINCLLVSEFDECKSPY